ncbi:MAG: hypothetical protein Ct9H300mP1_21340 [Planctomycetaceae bacterium]|nr:MAG: hypothetical protein Ct9H300mP1_21340 [Planctomycetaceae bacterium]
MSTADSFLNIGAAAIVHDIPRAYADARSTTSALGTRRHRRDRGRRLRVALASGNGGIVGAVGWSVFFRGHRSHGGHRLQLETGHPLACNLAILTSLVLNVGCRSSR